MSKTSFQTLRKSYICNFLVTGRQACVSGVAKFSQRNHVVQNLRAYFMLHVITIKWMMCVQEKIELSGTSKRPRLSSTKISGEPLLVAKKKQQ